MRKLFSLGILCFVALFAFATNASALEFKQVGPSCGAGNDWCQVDVRNQGWNDYLIVVDNAATMIAVNFYDAFMWREEVMADLEYAKTENMAAGRCSDSSPERVSFVRMDGGRRNWGVCGSKGENAAAGISLTDPVISFYEDKGNWNHGAAYIMFGTGGGDRTIYLTILGQRHTIRIISKANLEAQFTEVEEEETVAEFDGEEYTFKLSADSGVIPGDTVLEVNLDDNDDEDKIKEIMDIIAERISGNEFGVGNILILDLKLWSEALQAYQQPVDWQTVQVAVPIALLNDMGLEFGLLELFYIQYYWAEPIKFKLSDCEEFVLFEASSFSNYVFAEMLGMGNPESPETGDNIYTILLANVFGLLGMALFGKKALQTKKTKV